MNTGIYDVNTIVSQYIWGQQNPPENMVDDSFIGNSAPTSLAISTYDYMTTGPGRFARASMSSLVQEFFFPEAHGVSLPPPGTYTKSELEAYWDNHNYGITYQQYNYSDNNDDAAIRTFLYNSTNLKLSDGVRFVIAADGTRYMTNVSVVPRTDENFDFESNNWAADITASYLQDNMDTSRIGQTVNLVFDSTVPIIKNIYTIDDYVADAAYTNSVYVGLSNSAHIVSGVNTILDQLWNDGISKFLDLQERPLIYGTDDDDSITPYYFKNNANEEAYSSTSNTYWADYAQNGYHLMGGGGNDILIGSTQAVPLKAADLAKANFTFYHSEWNNGVSDVLNGGTGQDSVVLVSDVESNNSSFFDTRPPDNIRKVLESVDYIDGSDADYTAYIQHASPGASSSIYSSFTSTSTAAAIAGGDQVVGKSEFFYQGNWEQVADVVGFRVDDVSGMGAVLLLGSWGASWGQEFYGGVTIARDLSKTGGQWTVLGGDPSGTPNLQAQGISEQALAATGADTLFGGNAQDGIYAYGGNDLIKLGAYAGGIDTVDGGDGSDTADYSGVSSNLVITIADMSNGSVTGLGTENNDILINIENIVTGDGNDNIIGSSTANRISTGDGNDTISGDAGNDSINGGAGDDIIVAGAGADTISGGSGNDIASYLTAAAAVTVNLATPASNTGEALGDVYSSIESIVGSAYSDTFVGNVNANNFSGGNGNDTLWGAAGVDVLSGNAGNDVIDGGTEGDTLAGGAGNDIYVVDNIGDMVKENASEGTDTVQASINYSIAALANLERITLTGTSAINATGNAVANILIGNSASNTLDGGAGGDALTGGAGNDIYIVDNINDIVNENASEGTDTVKSSVTLTLADDVENLTLTGASAINATGNALANVLTGNDAVNTLTGGDGNDTLNGGGGADILVGGVGSDKYYVDDDSDIVTEASGSGADTVFSTISWSLGSNVERLTLLGTAATGTGNTLSNILTGNDVANTLDGGAGVDTLIGGAGSDIYIVDNDLDSVTEEANEGTDTIKSSITLTLGDNIEKLTLTGTDDIDGIGNTLNNTLYGNSYANSLSGSSGNDFIRGYSGNDVINGGSGNDTIYGGKANDALTGSSGSDVFAFAVDDDTDTINDFVSGTDKIDLSAITEITSYSDLKAQHLADKGTYLLISSNGGADTIKLIGLDALSDVTSSDFIFA